MPALDQYHHIHMHKFYLLLHQARTQGGFEGVRGGSDEPPFRLGTYVPPLFLQYTFLHNYTLYTTLDNSMHMEALKHGKEPISYARVMFLGEGESGKSSVLDGLMKEKFTENKNSTMLAETRDISYQFIEAEKGHWSKMDEKAELAKKVVKGEDSSSNGKEWPQAEEEFGKKTNTVSQGQAELVPELAEKASDAHKQCCKDVSSKAQQLEKHMSSSKSDVLHVWDCGGQPVFLDILSAFITARTMFLLLFDASKDLFCNKVRETGIRV